MSNWRTRVAVQRTVAGLVAAVGLGLAGCAAMPANRGVDRAHPPVVEQAEWAIDLAAGGPEGLPLAEQQRLAGWFEAVGVRAGDRVMLEDPAFDGATRGAVVTAAARFGAVVAVGVATAGEAALAPGFVRVVVGRRLAHVPNCPDWSTPAEANLAAGTHSNFGCAVNANLAAMVADPEHLVRGARSTGEVSAFTAIKAIESHRKAPPTGEKGLSEVASNQAPSQ